MYTAYYDTSGSQTDPSRPLVVVGLISTERRWLLFEREWKKALAEFEAPYLHMKEFAHSKGPFQAWKGDEEKRGKFLQRLLMVLKRNVNRAEIMHVPPREFAALNQTYRIGEVVGGCYPLAAALCQSHMNHWLQTKHPSSQIIHIFEEGDAGAKLFASLYSLPGKCPIIRSKSDPVTKEWFAPFQAADLIAYEIATEILREDEGQQRSRASRRPFLAILEHFPHTVREMNSDILAPICEQFPAFFPRRSLGSSSEPQT